MLKLAITGLSLFLLSSCSMIPGLSNDQVQNDSSSCSSDGESYKAGTIIVEDGTLNRCMQTDVNSAWTWVEYPPSLPD